MPRSGLLENTRITVDDNGYLMSSVTVPGLVTTRPNPQYVTPVDYTTVSATFVDLAGSVIDTLYNPTVTYTVKNTGGSTIKWQVLGALQADFSDAVIVKVSATIAATASDTYSVSPAPYRYYKVQVGDNVGGSHGIAHSAILVR